MKAMEYDNEEGSHDSPHSCTLPESSPYREHLNDAFETSSNRLMSPLVPGANLKDIMAPDFSALTSKS